MRSMQIVSALVLSAALAACGGGGGGSDATPTTPVAPVTPVKPVDPVVPVVPNNPPTAVILTQPTVIKQNIATFDGKSSTDPEGGALTYKWSFISKPAGSGASMVGATLSVMTFSPDVIGVYAVDLTVTDNKGSSNTSSAKITVVAANSPPVANAGPNQNILLGSPVTLDGSKSSDADGNPITYTWTLITKPSGSLVDLTAPNSVNPVLIPDVAGNYVASLTVNDGTADSVASTATIGVTAPAVNAPPTADAGANTNIVTGSTIILDGSKSSDANGDALTYSWQFTAVPAGSNAVIADPKTAHPSFKPNVDGAYTVALVVNDGKVNSASVSVTVNAQPPALIKPLIPAGMPAWAANDWINVVSTKEASTILLHKITFGPTGVVSVTDNPVTTLILSAATPGHKTAAVSVDTFVTDLFTLQPSWSGNELSGYVCWLTGRTPVSGNATIPVNLCHSPTTGEWKYDGYFGSIVTGYYSSAMPVVQQFSVKEAMRKGMSISQMFQTGFLLMGVNQGLIYTTSIKYQPYVPTVPQVLPYSAAFCSNWTFDSNMLLKNGEQANCDASQPNYKNRWTVTSSSPMPDQAQIGQSGVLAVTVLDAVSTQNAVLFSTSMTWMWDLRSDVTTNTALLCASRWQSLYSDYNSRIGGYRCFRVEKSGAVTGILVPEYSAYVQTLQ